MWAPALGWALPRWLLVGGGGQRPLGWQQWGLAVEGTPGHRPLFQVVNRLGLDSLAPFKPKERIIE